MATATESLPTLQSQLAYLRQCERRWTWSEFMRAQEELTPDLLRHMLRVCGRSTAQPLVDCGADAFRTMVRVLAATRLPGDGQRAKQPNGRSSTTGGDHDWDGDRPQGCFDGRRLLEAKNSALLSLPEVIPALRCRRRHCRRPVQLAFLFSLSLSLSLSL